MTVRNNTLISLVGNLVPIAVMLVTVPVFIASLGEARFGVLSLVWLLTGYLMFFDFGIGQTISYELAQLDDDAVDDRRRIFWTGLLLAMGFSLVGVPAMYGLAYLLFSFLIDMPAVVRAEIVSVLPWVAFALVPTILNAFFSGTLVGRQRFVALNLKNAFGLVVVNLTQLYVALRISPTLDMVVPAAVIGLAISSVPGAALAFRAVSAGLRPHVVGPATIRRMLGYGGWVSVGSVAREMIANTDRIIVGWLSGANALAIYAVVLNLARRANFVPIALSEALFPVIAKRRGAEREELLRKAIRVNAAIGLIVAGTMSVAMKPFLWVWIRPEFAEQASLVGHIFATSAFVGSAGGFAVSVLRASGDAKSSTLILLSQVVPFLVGLYLGGIWFGIAGIAVVRLLRQMIDSRRMYAKLGLFAYATKVQGPVLAMLVACTGLVFLPGSPWSFASLIVRGGILGAMVVWALWLSPEIVRLLPARLRFWEKTA